MKKTIFCLLCIACAVTAYAAEGVLTGKFSVSADQQVQFSPGNLLYQPHNETWRFAENQFDFVGSNTTKGNVVYAFDRCSNSKIDKHYDGWIDLFGWGTGNDPVQIAEDGKAYAHFNDWGQNTILNSGYEPVSWRTLTWDEWFYLLIQRANADQLRSQATVNNVHGYILLPDNWQLPKKITFKPNSNDWTTNTYADREWQIMERAGAVFLPAAGFRSVKEVSVVQLFGFYWSSTAFTDKTDEARDIFFGEKRIGPRDHEKRFYGLSVRLVTDAK